MKKINVEIKGITPYIQNRFIGEEALETTKKKVITGKQASVEDKIYKVIEFREVIKK